MASNAPCLHKDSKGNKCWNSVFKNGYCEKHQPEPWYNPNYKKPKNWESLKRFVIARDRGVCYICGEGGSDSVDHIVPKSEGGSDLTENLAAVHEKIPPHCHKEKTKQESLRGRRLNKFKKYGSSSRIKKY